ncbi:MAG: asparagine synthase (glutamine-hydrolyzing), partial [Cyclobacteriaceae bacterium]|nr:asparagine synthase (glutamine-hydrolyzing) [Cyclobacteriaceae bacterium]
MCGITGIYAFNLVGRFHMINLANATKSLERRGPDHQNTFHNDFVGLGHRRLAVIDTSIEANQPMTDPSGRYVLVYNGEIYNYKEHRQRLEKQGESFSTQSDTEVLLKMLVQEGKECLPKLNGFFAFAFYDKEENYLLLAIDRYGIKPLYYLCDEDKVLFGSEMKALFEYGLNKELDHTALSQYFQLNYTPGPETMIKGVKKLMPGEYVEVGSPREEPSPRYKRGLCKRGLWYELPYRETINAPLSYDEACVAMGKVLENAVQKRLVADVPLGSFLSGGIDSSIVAMLAKRHKKDLHTFSIGFKDEKYFDETGYANQVAQKIGSEHTVYKLEYGDFEDNFKDILNSFDEPFADSSAIAYYLLSKKVRKQMTVALSGDGADEIFGGYNKHRAFYRAYHPNAADKTIGALRYLWKVLPASRHNSLTNKFRQLQRFADGMALDAQGRYERWAVMTEWGEVERLLSPRYKRGLSERYKPSPRYKRGLSDINDVLYADMQLVLPWDMLVKADRMSMANSLEVRVPFLDHEVVEL